MSDKLKLCSEAFFTVSDVHPVRLEGRDAVAFAQAQFTNDVAALPDGGWHWSAWLTPKGRVIALFAVLRVSAERLDLLLLDAEPAAFVAALQRFVFRSKLAITVPDVAVTGALHTPSQARGGELAMMGTDAIEIDFGSDACPRTLRIVDRDGAAPADVAAAATWRRLDISHGLPRLAASQQAQWTPQQLSLDRLRAYSVKKGCYPGQEIVARTHFLGQAKRGLQCLQSAVDVEAGSDVVAGDAPIGKLVSSADDLHLAVLPLDDTAPAVLTIGGQPAHVRPLHDGLAR